MGQLTGVALLGTFFYCRLQARSGGAPVEVTTARPLAIVQALHDQFYLAAVLIAAGTTVAFWRATREWREQKAGKTRPAAGMVPEGMTEAEALASAVIASEL